MAKDPAFLFYPGDFIVGTMAMPFEDKGKYITILSMMHQQGRMKEETIRFIVGNVSDNLKNKFSIDNDGLWFNERLEKEIEKRSKFTESRRINGSKGGRPKEIKPSGLPSGKPKKNLPEDENINENKDWNELKDKLLNQEKWHVSVIRATKLKTIDNLKKQLDKFFILQEAKDNIYDNEQNYKSHFVSWVNIKKETEVSEPGYQKLD